MTELEIATIEVDQFIAAIPEKVWRALTTPELHEQWWAPGDIAADLGHRFHLEMPGWGSVACEVTVSQPYERFAYTFNGNWTISWRLVAEGTGTRLFLDHSGFDLSDHRSRDAFDRMGPGWRDVVVPRLAALVTESADAH
ncbi:SRPBCC domain-containing protein [Aldersonia sp. NBC_00410]|uniref:SRPBCC family protein n=1 Tax=Aldersonia sp. NBC_00410 TaxID=2975954 RepID=UPI0022524124|nr:SRPBCC domain-containing protein [Aldersonia sp. NBC_00410]MCX5046509.1 SRPBCC domain-containing protein [Aldersonia sp. NBC_00410]